MHVQDNQVAQGEPREIVLHVASSFRRLKLGFIVVHRLGRQPCFRICILVPIGAGGPQIITRLESFISANIQVDHVLGGQKRIKFIGHQDAPGGLARGGSVAVKSYIAKYRRFALHERNRDVTGKDIAAVKLWHGNRNISFNMDHADNSPLKIRLADLGDFSPLPFEEFIAVGVAHPPYDVVLIALFGSGSVDKDPVNISGIA